MNPICYYIFKFAGLIDILEFSHYHPKKKYCHTTISPDLTMSYIETIIPFSSILPEESTMVSRSYASRSPAYKKNLQIEVNISEEEYLSVYKKAMRDCPNMNKKNTAYYHHYLKNILGYKYETSNIDYILRKIKQEFEYVDFAVSTTKPREIELVTNLLHQDNYFAKNTKRAGLTVKMFTTKYDNNEAIVKIYMYDPACKMLSYSIEANFQNEVVFQNYAKQMNKPLDFISPEIYSIGKIRNYKPDVDIIGIIGTDAPECRCLFIIMEYIPGITLKHAVYSSENMKDIYERVDEINGKMKSVLLHHNDLHSSNILLCDNDTNSPDICIIDFGEASYGPTEKI